MNSRFGLFTLVLFTLATLCWTDTLALAQPSGSATPAGDTTAAAAAQDAASDGEEGWQDKIIGVIGRDAFEVGQKILLGILLFLAGWIIAKLISWMVFRVMLKTTWDDKLARKLGLNILDESGDEQRMERITAKVVYYLLMMLVIVGVLQYAGLSQAAGPIEGFVGKITVALPLIGKAILILVLAYFIGKILQTLVSRFIDGVKLDKRFAELSSPKPEDDEEADAEDEERPFSAVVGRVVFWLIMVAGLAGAVDALQIGPLAHSLRNAVDRIVTLLPAIAIAIVLVAVGYLFGRIARAVIDNLLDAIGLNKLVARLSLDKLFGDARASGVIGLIAMAFIMIQAIIAALNELELTTLSEPLTGMMAQFWLILPVLAVSGLIIAAGVIGGRLLRSVIETALINLKFDEFMQKLGFGELEEREGRLSTPHQVIGLIVQLAIILVATVQALDNLSLDRWSAYVNGFIEYSVTHVAIALVIVAVGLAVGNYVRDLVLMRQRDGEDETIGWIATFSRYAVLVFAFTMAIHHLNIGPNFVLVAFALLFGSLCLALALALGLGSREVAGEIVRRQYDKARSEIDARRHTGDSPESSSDE